MGLGMDYREDRDIKKNFLKISIKGIIRSVLSILLGLLIIYTTNIHGEIFFFYMLYGAIAVVMGIVGLIGSFHKYKELPEGIMCLYPGRMGWFMQSLGGLIFVLYFGMLFLTWGLDTLNTLAGVAIVDSLPIRLFILSMIGILYNRTHGIVVAEDCLYILKFKGMDKIKNQEIGRIKSKLSSTKTKVFDHDGKLMFTFSSTWFNYLDFVKYLDENMRDKY